MPPPSPIVRADVASASCAAAIDRVPCQERARLRRYQKLSLAQHALHRKRAQVHKRLHLFEGRGRIHRLDWLKIAGENRHAGFLFSQEHELAGLGNCLHFMKGKPVELRLSPVSRRHNGNPKVEERQHFRIRVRARLPDIGGIRAFAATAIEAGLRGELWWYEWLVHESSAESNLGEASL